MAPKKTLPPELDPIFPITTGYELPPVRQDGGKEIMDNDTLVTITLPYRSLYFLWEYAERQGAKQYPKYVGGPIDHVAQTWLDAVYAFRNRVAEIQGKPIRRFSEEKAQKARAIRAKREAEAAAKLRESAAVARAAKKANNASEGDASEAPESLSETPKPTRSSGKARKSASRAQKASKRPVKRKARSSQR